MDAVAADILNRLDIEGIYTNILNTRFFFLINYRSRVEKSREESIAQKEVVTVGGCSVIDCFCTSNEVIFFFHLYFHLCEYVCTDRNLKKCDMK